MRPVFNCLAELDKPSDSELIIITDGNQALQKAVDKRLDSISFSRIQVINFGDQPAEDIDSRRYRISAIHNKARHFVPDNCDYVFSIEDDTTYPPDTLNKMLDTMSQIEDCAFVEGVQVGRHKTKYIGAWAYAPDTFMSLLPGDGLVEIAAGGLYCALIKADLYKQHHFEPFDKQGKNGLSCDVNFGLWLRQQGYSCLISWDIICDHIGEFGSINLGNTTPVRVTFTKGANGVWSSVATPD